MRLSPLFFLIVFLFLKPDFSLADQSDIHHKCYVAKGVQIQCDIRFANPWEAAGSPEKVEVVWPDGEREEIKFNAYNPNEKTTAWLLLFDRSQSLDKKSVEVIRKDFGRIISGLRSKEKLGIASFAENFQLLSAIGAPRGELVDVLKDLKPVGKKTYLYQSALEGLEVLRTYRAQRKALVIISDGRSEDSPNISYQNVIDKAKEFGIVVYGIGYSEKPENDVYLNELQEIARRTQGPSQKEQLYREDARVLSPRLMQYFLDFMQNGGQATFTQRMAERDVTVKLVATLDDGRQLATRVDLPNIYVPPKPVEVKAKETGLLGLPKEYEVIVIATVAGLLLLFLLVFLIWIVKRSSSSENSVVSEVDSEEINEGVDEVSLSDTTETIPEQTVIETDGIEVDYSDDATRIIGNNGQAGDVYAFLEQLGDNSKRIELTSTAVSVGRHKDNDIRFSSSTVHRRHATLHMNSEKIFVITDLSGDQGNGISINGDRISTAKLESGDLIELGDVRLRFIES